MFWITNEIINTSLLRASRDEEIVAYIIANIILRDGERDAYTAETLNKYYGYDPNPLSEKIPVEMTKIENAVDRISSKVIEKQFNTVLSIIKETLVLGGNTFKGLLYQKPMKNWSNLKDLAYPFQAVFVAIHTLVFRENLSVVNYDLLFDLLRGLGDELFEMNELDDLRLVSKMNTKTAFVMGKIRKAFEKSNLEDPAVDDWTMQCTNIIMKSRTEQNLYDFKIGAVTFGEKKISTDGIDKILKTLTAINNIGPNKAGYIIMGIADKMESAVQYNRIYGGIHHQVDETYIVGVELEAKKIGQSLDRYTHSIKEYIRQHKAIPTEYKTHILQNMFTPLFYGHQLIVFKTCYNEPVMYDDKLYERMFSDVHEVPAAQYGSVYKRFFTAKSE